MTSENVGVDPFGPNYVLEVLGTRTSLLSAAWSDEPDRLPSLGRWELTGGSDGSPPSVDDYVGRTEPGQAPNGGLSELAAHADVALLCVPDVCQPSLPSTERARLAEEVVAQAERHSQLAILAPEAGDLDPVASIDSADATVYGPGSGYRTTTVATW